MKKIDNGVFVVLSSKGGVGKTTFSTQFLIPFLVEMRGLDRSLPKLYEVDYKNNGSQTLSESKIIDSHLIKDSKRELENIVVKEASNFMRDYPVVFDIGVGEFDSAHGAFGNNFDDAVLYIVPVKTSEEDYNNALDTVNRVRKADQNAEFVFVCSDSKNGANELSFLEEEFGLVFGTWLNPKTRKPFAPLFKAADAPEKFVVLKSTELFDKSSVSYKTTLYESAMEGLSIKGFLKDKGATEAHPIDVMITDVKKRGVKEKDPKKVEELLAESEFLSKTRRHYLNCASFYESHISPSFRTFLKYIG